jgi:hypothetical protein
MPRKGLIVSEVHFELEQARGSNPQNLKKKNQFRAI